MGKVDCQGDASFTFRLGVNLIQIIKNSSNRGPKERGIPFGNRGRKMVVNEMAG